MWYIHKKGSYEGKQDPCKGMLFDFSWILNYYVISVVWNWLINYSLFIIVLATNYSYLNMSISDFGFVVHVIANSSIINLEFKSYWIRLCWFYCIDFYFIKTPIRSRKGIGWEIVLVHSSVSITISSYIVLKQVSWNKLCWFC